MTSFNNKNNNKVINDISGVSGLNLYITLVTLINFLEILIGFLFVNNLFRPKIDEGKNKD
jgi:DNA polymerase sigma